MRSSFAAITIGSHTKIIVCTITSVTGSYSGNDGLDNAAVKDANRWLAQICADTDVYLADAASCVSERDGTLETQYASANGKTPNLDMPYALPIS